MQFKITNGTFSYGTNTILKEIDFEIKDGEKVALCGRNGSGKTTLLKLITGELKLETNIDDNKVGSVTKIGVNNIGYLKQIVFTDENITLEEEIMKVFSPIISIQNKLEELQKILEKDHSEYNVNAYSTLQQKFIDMGGYYYQKEYNSMLKAFKFIESDKYKKIGEFSGGQKTKIAFVKLLLEKPDILVFDEPTNHLDIDSIEWLEDYLATYPKSLIIVSHDRDFLDKVVNVVYEIEYGKTKRYVGNYSNFVKQKQEDYVRDLERYKAQREKIKREEELIEKFRYKATKASMVQSRIKALEKMEKLENPQIADTKTFHFNIDMDNSGKEVLEVEDLLVGYDKVLAKINLKVMRGDKIGIIGGNGIGKSTFLKTLAGKIKSLGGNYKYGHNVKIGYFEQQVTKHTSTKTIYEDYIEEFSDLTETEARTNLGSFLFSKEDIYKQLNELSGGEMVRFELLKIFKKNPNVLLLDEPTNHLDLVGKETLEKMLTDYKGTILVVSHDRYFIKKVTKAVLVFENGEVNFYEDGYNQYLQKRKPQENIEIKKEQKPLTDSNINYIKSKEKAKKERMLRNIEEKIKLLEEEIDLLKIKINTPEIFENVDKLLNTNAEIENKNNELNALYEKWEELS